MSSIVASVPGRLRVRHEALRNPALLERLEAKVRSCTAVTGVEAKASAASLVVYYDTAQWSEAQSHQRIGTVAASVLPRKAAAPPVASAAQRPPHPARGRLQGKERSLQANRWAKRAMLGSLAVSMLLAAQGAKRGHALTGLLFLHALGLHLWVHRRNLLK